MCCWRKKAVVTCDAGVTVSVLLLLPLSVFLQCKVRRGCDGVTCWDEACVSLALLACDAVPLTRGTLVSLWAAPFPLRLFAQILAPASFHACRAARAPCLHGRLVDGAAPGDAICKVQVPELPVGWGRVLGVPPFLCEVGQIPAPSAKEGFGATAACEAELALSSLGGFGVVGWFGDLFLQRENFGRHCAFEAKPCCFCSDLC